MHGTLAVEPGATLSGKARRIVSVRMPDDYLALEARAAAEHAHLHRAERDALKATADRAVVEYPRYQRAKERLQRV